MSVLYAELRPQQFRERLAAAPIAYLPLGTLEWHGEHLPLGSDGLQSQGFFLELAQAVGGIVLPMLFLGPDRKRDTPAGQLYGMDLCLTSAPAQRYPTQQLDGSAYWAPDDLFHALLRAALAQLARAGFRIVVGHGHGPSTKAFAAGHAEWLRDFGLQTLTCWGSDVDQEGLGVQVDHAAMNETSLVMALRPELVDMSALPSDPQAWPVGVGGQDPRMHASRELGQRIIAMQKERMAGLLRKMLAELST